MKSSSKKSAIKWLLGGFTAFTLTISLAGCSQTAEESPELEKTTDASLAETADYVPASADGPAQNVPEPRMPAIATEDSEDGAEAALRHFWAAVDYARLTGDADPLELVSHEMCALCTEYMGGWSKRYADGDWAALHGKIKVDISHSKVHREEDSTGQWIEIYFELTEPSADLYINGERDAAESFEERSSAKWIADLSFDASSERWLVEWAGLEEQVEAN